MKIAVLLVSLTTVAAVSDAQQERPALVESVRSFRCDFTESVGRRRDTMGRTEPATRETFADLVVDLSDPTRKIARLVGNTGSDTVQMVDGAFMISFVEVTRAGNVAVLSILKKEVASLRYEGVFSRHLRYSSGDSALSQSYGTCRGLL